MQLLVSVAGEADALEALRGGADWIDAKDPAAGPLGPVTIDQVRRIHAAIAGRRPLSVALGDIDDEASAARAVRQAGACGAELVKIGVDRTVAAMRLERLTAAAVRGGRDIRGASPGVVMVAYADRAGWRDRPETFVAAVAQGGAAGVLLDTADKQGPGLCECLSQTTRAAWVAAARRAGVLVAMAGRVTLEEVRMLRECEPDVIGVRGAACRGGRSGFVVAERVTALHQACRLPRPRERPLA